MSVQFLATYQLKKVSFNLFSIFYRIKSRNV